MSQINRLGKAFRKTNRPLHGFFMIVSAATALSVGPAQAADTSAPTAQPAAPSNSQPLQGKVQKVELSLEKLRDVGLDLKHILKAASSLYDEVTIQPVRLITEPEVVGRGIVINIPIGTEPIGPPQPARKERVDLAMSGMTPLINMMKKNVDDFMSGNKQLDLPDDVMTELDPQFKQWTQMVNTMAANETQLEKLTQAPPYNNDSIAKYSVAIQKDVKELDETRRSIYKVIRKEGKRIASRQTSGS